MTTEADLARRLDELERPTDLVEAEAPGRPRTDQTGELRRGVGGRP